MSGQGKDYYQRTMVLSGGGVQHGHTLWGLVQLLAMVREVGMAAWQQTLYSVLAGLLFLSIAGYAVFRETERWKLVLYAVVPGLVLPFVSADYTLIQVYFPLVFFLNAPRVSRLDRVYVVLFALLLIPQDYYYLPIYSLEGTSISVIGYSVVLLGLLVMAIFDRGATADAGRPSMAVVPSPQSGGERG